MIIQLLLLAGFGAVSLAAARMGPSPRHLAVRRLSAMALLAAAAMAVLFPDLVTQLAHVVGVGRGTDLVLYLFVVASAVVWLGVYRRFTEMDARMTQLVRALALAEAARAGDDSTPTDGRRPARADA
jgi:small membrane protein